MKVYTRGGDTGETSLFGGERVSKHTLRVESYGAVDELNALLGVCASAIEDSELAGIFRELQNGLFDVGGELATPDVEKREKNGKGIPRVDDADVEQMEKWMDGFDEELAPLRNFVLPGGHPGAAHLHFARTVARRAERRVVELRRTEPVSDAVLRYLNRLSDLLFVLARVVNQRAGIEEPTWEGRSR